MKKARSCGPFSWVSGLKRQAFSALAGLPSVSWLFKWQGHAAQVTLGLNQYQGRVSGHHQGWTLTRHMLGFDFSGHRSLGFSDLAGIGVDPLQTGGLGDLAQVLQRQVVRLDFRQAGRGLCRRCSCRNRCCRLGHHWCYRCCDGYSRYSWRRRECCWCCRDDRWRYIFSSCWRPFPLALRLI